MPRYHPKKAEAQAAATLLEQDPRVASTYLALEPYNGWVVVLIPKFVDCSDLAAEAEIRDGVKRPAPKVRPAPVDQPVAARHGGKAPRAEGEVPAPTKGATAKVWEIAGGMASASRGDIIAACVAEGINAATAATQYSKWKKANG